MEGLLNRYSDKQFLIHNYFPPAKRAIYYEPCCPGREVAHPEHCSLQEAIDLCSLLNCPLYSFHPGFRVYDTLEENFNLAQPIVPYEEAYEAFSRSLEEILSFARERGIGIAVENLEHKNDAYMMNAYMMTRPDEFSRLQRRLPGIGSSAGPWPPQNCFEKIGLQDRRFYLLREG